MNALTNDDEFLETEEEIDESPFIEFDISVAPSDLTLELLASKIDTEDIIIPFYQRNFVWKIEQASRLVESFLMGLPVPQIFLYVNDEDQLEVIDGQQRLLSVKYFFEGFFGEADSKGRRQEFRLKGLSEISQYNGKKYSDLSAKEQRKLRNSTLRAINIKQLVPSTRNDSVFHIFERLNTGGTQLKPQEIRNAVYRGKIVECLKELNSLPQWQEILGIKKQDKNQKDVELILRLFSLYHRWEEYEKPMLKFLNSSMAEDKHFNSSRAFDFYREFPIAVNKVKNSLTRPFRPKGVINSAVLESVMITLLENPDIKEEQLTERYPTLLENEDYNLVVRGSTTDTAILKRRIEVAGRILCHGEI
ncbi:GmrSD restriction endonuclease domain-containing protein [Pantoea sp. FN060301]|uniref:DUF262 domain-containing protein n=1 Tax=Pantoea sp. FN060301 TaxID=3420380 RepID=UPI003D17E873